MRNQALGAILKNGGIDMICRDFGVQPGSEYYFATPSFPAKRLFYYVLCVGNYICSTGYQVKRERYPSILIMQILEGTCFVRQGNRTALAQEGDTILLNCYEPHEYSAQKPLKMMWMHFDGGQSIELCETIQKERGFVFSNTDTEQLKKDLDEILSVLRSDHPLSEASVSCIIYNFLCRFLLAFSDENTTVESRLIEKSLLFLREHYHSDLTVDDIAKQAAVSASHFSRIFRKAVGASPYEYLITLRLNQAKKLLRQTDLSIDAIAEKTGFHSTANFTALFHRRVGVSPSKFRRTPF